MAEPSEHRGYRKRRPVHAFLVCGPAEYPLSEGRGTQRFDGPHMRVEVREQPDTPAPAYGVGLDDFVLTYANAERPGTYRKKGVTMARVASERFVLRTDRKGESVETTVEPGDYLVREADGSGEYHVPKARFEALYVPDQ